MLPPGRLGWRLGQRLTKAASPVAEMVESVTQGQEPRAVDVDVDLGAGRRLRGTVTGLYGERIVIATYSRLGPRQWLEAWIPLLALCATHPGRHWSAGAIGKGEKGRYGAPDEEVARVAFASVDGATELLRDLVAMYDAGQCEPLPLPLKTGNAWAARRRPGNDMAVRKDAEFKWLSNRFPGENDDAAHVAVWGAGAPLEVLLGEPAPRRGVRRRNHPARRPGHAAVAPHARTGEAMSRTRADDPAPFDILGPLPRARSTTVLEASAGTGKTFTVGALVARYVAEGIATLDEMLVITFGRAASQELRERVREQLVAAERALSDPSTVTHDDVLLTHLVSTDVELRHKRITDALAGFDGATIATTHQFCQLVLRSLGVAGDTDSHAELVESLDDLVVEVTDDLFLQRFGSEPEPPPFGRSVALQLARAAVGDPQAELAPTEAEDGSTAAAKVDFAEAVRVEVERRKHRRGVLSYDDLLSRLADALVDEDAPARERMRQRWKVVLVDEFQDTDPVQWDVLDRAFTGHATLILIGDPKQAIYAFRGGDVVAYLRAAATAATAQDPGHQLAQRRPAGRRPPEAQPWRRAWRSPRSPSSTSRRTTRTAGWSGLPRLPRCGCGSSGPRTSRPAATAPSASMHCVSTSRSTWRRT